LGQFDLSPHVFEIVTGAIRASIAWRKRRPCPRYAIAPILVERTEAAFQLGFLRAGQGKLPFDATGTSGAHRAALPTKKRAWVKVLGFSSSDCSLMALHPLSPAAVMRLVGSV
jgi:hypothetical protein